MNKLRHKTKCRSIRGFNGDVSILPRYNFGVSGQESSSQSLTADTLNRLPFFFFTQTFI
ncbi:MAG: hypothetical protein IH598_15985 [Bacteroidales bacterium]|nr:hypothetical protein [Bacteroidales bacterium]